MKVGSDTSRSSLIPALEAINNLTARELAECFNGGQIAAVMAHGEIGIAPISRKSAIFYRHLLPLRTNAVSALVNSYRRYLKLALAHPLETDNHPDKWAWQAIQPAVIGSSEWLGDWYILACDGENQYVQKVGSVPYAPGETVSASISLTDPPLQSPSSWRAPAWLFEVSPILGIFLLRSEHVPAIDSEDKLDTAHTRLLLKGARRSFLSQLIAAVEIVRNEEIAAAGAIPALTVGGPLTGEPKKPKHWLKGSEGLDGKSDLSRYMQGLTVKQQLAASLKWEHGLGLAEIASRMGIDRKTAHEHIEAAKRKIDQVRSSEKRKVTRVKRTPDF